MFGDYLRGFVVPERQAAHNLKGRREMRREIALAGVAALLSLVVGNAWGQVQYTVSDLVVRQVHFDRLVGFRFHCHRLLRRYNYCRSEPVIFRLADH